MQNLERKESTTILNANQTCNMEDVVLSFLMRSLMSEVKVNHDKITCCLEKF